MRTVVPFRRHPVAAFRTGDSASQFADIGRLGCDRLRLCPRAPTTDDLGEIASWNQQSAARLAVLDQAGIKHRMHKRTTAARATPDFIDRLDDPNAVAADRFRKGGGAAMRADIVAARIQRHSGTAVRAVHRFMIARTRRVGESVESLIVSRWPVDGGHGYVVQPQIHRQLTAMMGEVID